MKYCKKCGAELPEGVSFCEKCGNPVGQVPNQGKSKKKWLIAISSGVIILAVAIVGVLFVNGVIGGKDKAVQVDADSVVQETPSLSGEAQEEDITHILDEGEDSDYFSSAKLSRDQKRAKNKEALMEIINNKSVTSEEKKAAVEEMAQITQNAEQEKAAEMLLEAKGYADVIVSISEGSADVLVNVENLTNHQMAQITDIVERKTDVSRENIVITPLNR